MSAKDKSSQPTPSSPVTSAGASASWLKSNLAAIGSAAVFSVYAAGFARTRAAAEQFADAPLVRRGGAARAIAAGTAPAPTATQPIAHNQPAPAVPVSPAPASVVGNAPPTVESPTPSAPSTAPSKTPAAAITEAPVTPALAPATAVAATKPAPAAQPSTVTASTLPVQSTAVAQATPKPAAAVQPALQPALPVPAPVPTPASTPTPAAPSSAADTAERTGGTYKDGTYSGWGTSRHGNIQATVEIKDGWIVTATISQCLTEYSCSWIAALPPQVTVRQNAEVDYVTGATQSSNAFYGALVQAIAKAK